MTTNSQKEPYASNPAHEPGDEMQSSGQQESQTVPVGSQRAPALAGFRDENIAAGAASVAESPQGQPQAPGADATENGAGGAFGYQQDTTARSDSGSATRPQTRVAGQTSQQELSTRPENARFGESPGDGIDGDQQSLLADPSGFARRWECIQVGFVDDPRSAVQEAETLVSNVMSEMTGMFQRQRQQLEEQWSGGNQASTDDLRIAFQRYRDFFQRLLQV
jgi:hypothetical protein